MTNNTKTILVLGNDIAVSLVEGSLGLAGKREYFILSYTKAQFYDPDWSHEAVLNHMQQFGKYYSAVIVDFAMRDAANAVKESGYSKPVIGLVSKVFDEIAFTSANVRLQPGSKLRIKEALDKYL